MTALRERLLNRRMLKLVALGYVVKTLLVAVAWVLVPDLPERVEAKVRAAWSAVSGPGSN